MSATLLESRNQHDLLGDPMGRCEIIDGVEVELPPMSVYSSEVGNRVFQKLSVFLEGSELGQAQHEVLFRLALPKDRNRIPDVAFTSYKRWPQDRPFPFGGNARDVVPDLAVEVVGPGDYCDELIEKIQEYLEAGVRLIWIVYCKVRQVHVYDSSSLIRKLVSSDYLDGGDVIPGFRIPVSSIFPPGATGN